MSAGSFTEVSCPGMPGRFDYLKPENNAYRNPIGTEVALLRKSEGGRSRMTMSKDTAGHGGEVGRVRGEKGSMTGTHYDGLVHVSAVNITKPPLPSGVKAGGTAGLTATSPRNVLRRFSGNGPRLLTSPGRST